MNAPLFNSPADWISPGFDDENFADSQYPMMPGSPPSHWYADPPVSDGRKVVITDSDHYAPGQGDALWAWKSFLRGHHPILMDFGLIGGVDPPDPSAGNPSYASLESVRYAMGDTRRYAEKVNLIAMEPRGDLTSTGYALAQPGNEYLVLQPNQAANTFRVALDAGNYSVEWFHINGRETKSGGSVTVDSDSSVEFGPAFANRGAVILHLKRMQV